MSGRRVDDREPCPVCGYRTISDEDDWCRVCDWDDAVTPQRPWEIADGNNQSVIEAQQEYLADPEAPAPESRHLRRPRPDEARDPGWTPIEVTPELQRRAAEARAAYDRELDAELEADRIESDAQMASFNSGLAELRGIAPGLGYASTRHRFDALTEEHGIQFAARHAELMTRSLVGLRWRSRRPWLAASWLLRHGLRHPRQVPRLWRELRTGSFHTVSVG